MLSLIMHGIRKNKIERRRVKEQVGVEVRAGQGEKIRTLLRGCKEVELDSPLAQTSNSDQ